MKKLMYLFVSLALVALAACGDKDGRQTEKPPVEEPQPEPGLPFTEYSLTGVPGEEFSVNWVNLDYIKVSNRLGGILVINSDNELKNYVEGDDYPPVDFSKKTLMLAYGENSGTAFGYDGLQFKQISGRNYELTITGIATIAAVMIRWHVAIVIDKLPSDSKIKLNSVITNLN